MNKTEKTSLAKKRNLKAYFRKSWLLYVFLLPFLAGIVIFKYYPMFGIQLAFKDWDAWGGIWGSPWATTDGKLDVFKHFVFIFNDEEFLTKLGNTVRISVLKLLFGFPIPILLTIFMNEMRSLKFKKFVQILLYFPHFISWVIISGILKEATVSGGAFQTLAIKLLEKELYFFTDSKLFLVLLIVSDVWKNSGWGTIIYLAAINGISPELYEAAEIDGANRAKKIWFITLPGILPAISINLIFNISGLMSAGFDQIYNMYNPAVYMLGDVLETYSYRIGIGGAQYAQATAMGLFNSIVAFVLIFASNYIVKKMGGSAIW